MLHYSQFNGLTGYYVFLLVGSGYVSRLSISYGLEDEDLYPISSDLDLDLDLDLESSNVNDVSDINPYPIPNPKITQSKIVEICPARREVDSETVVANSSSNSVHSGSSGPAVSNPSTKPSAINSHPSNTTLSHPQDHSNSHPNPPSRSLFRPVNPLYLNEEDEAMIVNKELELAATEFRRIYNMQVGCRM